ncbi:MAG TPA: hypothetical protein VMK13_07245 [Streptosporangiaceae bacterium]|nr:hypothetical protein [Streptosporangiaceae bacterium]
MLPSSLQVGTADAGTWRVVPAACNPAADDQGAWAVAAGDGGEEPDLYFEIGAECPKQVAEFIVAAVREHAHAVRFSAAVADVELERSRERSRQAAVTPANPHLPDALKLACLVEQAGSLAGELTYDPAGGDRAERAKRLYARLAQVAATTLGWMEAILSQDGERHERDCGESAVPVAQGSPSADSGLRLAERG